MEGSSGAGTERTLEVEITHDIRVPLSSEDLDEVDVERLRILSIRLDDSKVVAVNGEIVIGFARNVEQAEPVPDRQEAFHMLAAWA